MRVASALLLFLVVPASADEPVSLKWSMKEGDTFFATTKVSQDHTLEVGGRKVETVVRLDLVIRYLVKSVKKGETAVEVTFLAVGVRAEGISGTEKIGEKMHGCSVTLRLDDDQAVTGLGGHDEVMKRFRDASPAERAAAEILFGEAGVRELAGRPFDIMPREGLRIGGTATRPDRGTVGPLTTAGKTISKLERLEAGLATVVTTSEFAITAGAGPGSLAPPGVKIALKSDRAAGEYTFDTRSGRLKEFSHETVISGSLTAPDEGKDIVVGIIIRQKQSMSVSDKNPVRDK